MATAGKIATSTNGLSTIGTNIWNPTYADATTGPAAGTTLSANTGVTLDGKGSIRSTFSQAGTVSWRKTAIYSPLEYVDPKRLLVVAYVDHDIKHTGAMRLYGPTTSLYTGNADPYWLLNPGWNVIPYSHPKSEAKAFDWNQVACVQVQYPDPGANTYSTSLTHTSDIVGVWKNHTGTPVVTLSYDDAFKSMYDYAFPVMQRYKLRHSVNVVGYNSSIGERPSDHTEIADATELATMKATGLVEFNNHSWTHDVFETGPHTGYTSAGKEWTVYAPSGAFKLSIAGTETAAINQTAWFGLATSGTTANSIQKAIDGAWNPEIAVGTVGADYGILSTTNGARIRFTENKTMTCSSGGATVTNGWTDQEIADNFSQCRDWLVNSGLATFEEASFCVYPQGDYGPTVKRAMTLMGATGGRIMTPSQWGYVAGGAQFRAQPHLQNKLEPTRLISNLVSGSTAGANLHNAIGAVQEAIKIGGYTNLFFHAFQAGASAAAVLGTDDYNKLLAYLQPLHDSGAIRVMTQSEYIRALG